MTPQLVIVKAASRGRGDCRSCHAPIVWFEVAASGKRMPFDTSGRGTPIALKTSRHPSTGEALEHLDAAEVHWRTCPHAAEHRRAGAGR